MMVKSVSLGGNFVLNFGPDGKGNIRQEETDIAQEIGDWIKINPICSKTVQSCCYSGI